MMTGATGAAAGAGGLLRCPVDRDLWILVVVTAGAR